MFKVNWRLIGFLLLLVSAIIGMLVLIVLVLPNNSYVHQGDNISQGNYYDLHGMYGFSGEVAHWNNKYLIGQGVPDQIITIPGTGKSFIDPATMPPGEYWQWDGQYCMNGSDLCITGFGNDNAYVFYVVQQQMSLQTKTIVLTSNITIQQNGSTVQIPVTYTQVETFYATPAPTEAPGSSGTIVIPTTETPMPVSGPVNPDVQDQNGISIIGGVSGAVPVTPSAPVPIIVPVLAALGIFAIRRKK